MNTIGLAFLIGILSLANPNTTIRKENNKAYYSELYDPLDQIKMIETNNQEIFKENIKQKTFLQKKSIENKNGEKIFNIVPTDFIHNTPSNFKSRKYTEESNDLENNNNNYITIYSERISDEDQNRNKMNENPLRKNRKQNPSNKINFENHPSYKENKLENRMINNSDIERLFDMYMLHNERVENHNQQKSNVENTNKVVLNKSKGIYYKMSKKNNKKDDFIRQQKTNDYNNHNIKEKKNNRKRIGYLQKNNKKYFENDEIKIQNSKKIKKNRRNRRKNNKYDNEEIQNNRNESVKNLVADYLDEINLKFLEKIESEKVQNLNDNSSKKRNNNIYNDDYENSKFLGDYDDEFIEEKKIQDFIIYNDIPRKNNDNVYYEDDSYFLR